MPLLDENPTRRRGVRPPGSGEDRRHDRVTTVGVWRIGAGGEAGDAGEALDVAGRVDAADLSPSARTATQIDAARVHAERRHVGEATAAFVKADRLAPEHVRHLQQSALALWSRGHISPGERSPTYDTPTSSSVVSTQRRRTRAAAHVQGGHHHCPLSEDGHLRCPVGGCGPEGRGFESPRSPQVSWAFVAARLHADQRPPNYADSVPGHGQGRVTTRRVRRRRHRRFPMLHLDGVVDNASGRVTCRIENGPVSTGPTPKLSRAVPPTSWLASSLPSWPGRCQQPTA